MRCTMINGPCKNCLERYPGCHSNCDDYQIYVQEKDEHKKRRYVLKKHEYDLDGYYVAQHEKSKSR